MKRKFFFILILQAQKAVGAENPGGDEGSEDENNSGEKKNQNITVLFEHFFSLWERKIRAKLPYSIHGQSAKFKF